MKEAEKKRVSGGEEDSSERASTGKEKARNWKRGLVRTAVTSLILAGLVGGMLGIVDVFVMDKFIEFTESWASPDHSWAAQVTAYVLLALLTCLPVAPVVFWLGNWAERGFAKEKPKDEQKKSAFIIKLMQRKAVKVACLTSTVLLGASLLSYAVTYGFDPWEHHLSFGKDFHVGVWTGALHECKVGRICFFNDSDYGPYRGSIIGFIGPDGKTYPPLEREIGWGDSFGIYYRYFRWEDSTLWTLMLSWWYPFILFSILPCFWLVVKF